MTAVSQSSPPPAGSVPIQEAATAPLTWVSWLSIAYLIGVFGFTAYRAATLAITTDEAYSYHLYLRQDATRMFRDYNANLHFIHTLLTYLSTQWFGYSELAMRLPSVLACAGYLAAVFQISRRLFGGSILGLAACWLLTSNPLVLDHLALARGYGMAVAFFAWALVVAFGRVQQPQQQPNRFRLHFRLQWIAVFLALSMGANFTFLFPAAALVGTLLVLETAGSSKWIEGLNTTLRSLIGPWLVLSTLILMVPFSRMQANAFYFGAGNLNDSLRSLLEHSLGRMVFIGSSENLTFWSVVGVSSFATLLFAAYRFLLQHDPEARPVLLATTTLLATALAIFSAHQLFGILYPYARTGIFLLLLVPLWLLACLSAAWRAQPSSITSAARWVSLVAVLILALGGSLHMNPAQFMEWNFDANSRDIVAAIAEQSSASTEPIRVSAANPMWSSLTFYAKVTSAAHPVLEGLVVESDRWTPDWDYYVYRSWDDNEVAHAQELELEPIATTQPSGVVLAVPSDRTRELAAEAEALALAGTPPANQP